MVARIVFTMFVFTLGLPALADSTSRPISIGDRVAAQKAIEQVYWNHRIWPKDNPGPKPPLSAVLPDGAVRERVATYLRESSALDEVWRRPLSGVALQAEIDRIVRDSRDPNVLRELFAALGNDPQLIAETLGRQTLSGRLVRGWYASDGRFHGDLKRRAQAALASCGNAGCMTSMGGRYVETTWRRSDLLAERHAQDAEDRVIALDGAAWGNHLDRLARTFGASTDALPLMKPSRLEEDANGFVVTAILAQSADTLKTASVVWDKRPFDSWWESTARGLGTTIDVPRSAYSLRAPAAGGCSVDTWDATDFDLQGREGHTSVWTGSEMIVWGGGSPNSGLLNGGGRYNPATDSWLPTSKSANTPAGRYAHTAVWTGTRMVVWGGEVAQGSGTASTDSGGRYDPVTDSWTPTSTVAAPQGRRSHTVVWTGSEMIVWGGYDSAANDQLNTGGRYDPSSDSWRPVSDDGAPARRYFHTAVWSGSEMIVWGGVSAGAGLNTGGRYNPASDSWQPTAITAMTPSGVFGHTAVWTGSRMIVWGGSLYATNVSAGGRYDPSTDSWLPTSLDANVPAPRLAHTAVWTGTEMIVWGGEDQAPLDSGARYNPAANAWTTIPIRQDTPSARSGHTAIWTGAEMIVWGGDDGAPLNSGGRYAPSNNSWVATSIPVSGAPAARSGNSAVWTGTEMIVWGGYVFDGSLLRSGGRYAPATGSWLPTPAGGQAPSARDYHTAVWTGTEMIVWGGEVAQGGGTALSNTGGRYNPESNSWQSTSTSGSVPAARVSHEAVWTGTEMIVWGGGGAGAYLNSGGRYNPASNSWAATATAGAPAPRDFATAVWTGSEMIVWGGDSTSGYSNSGGRYNPASNSWQATSQGAGVPSVRANHSAVWTGNEMIVWGGASGSPPTNTGGRYDPAGDSWTPTSITPGTPSARLGHSAVWTGTEMVVWGGSELDTGSRYNPSNDAWLPTSTAGAPTPRSSQNAVWTGIEMIVWGGTHGGSEAGINVLGTGGRYCADSCASPTTLYEDADGDGYGVAGVSQVTCASPAGWAAVAGDCNDGDATVHPSAADATCNLVDNDCDGLVDEDVPNVDDDLDGIRNACDVCADAYDPVQSDSDHDGQGDLCDPDDGVIYLSGLDRDHIRWNAESGPTSWNVYEGDLGVLRTTGVYTQTPGSNSVAHRRCGVTGTIVDDPASIPAGAVKFALVTGVTGGVEGSLGTDGQGNTRPNTNPCP
jgi:N-acetylneuraminic acid mutarotase